MKRNNCARYLLLFGSKESPRAVLFDEEERLLAEMIDEDGFLVDSLLREGRAVRPPSRLVAAVSQALRACAKQVRRSGAGAAPGADLHLRCFALG
ncbi:MULTISPECIES: hypothetical protein [unclassified Rhizobacter]|nr:MULTISPECIES: hypothetical protein [unclassified Rhizobacter]KQU75911.1 hypothetical protein ASC88_23635 [Rhizobacter sp. Root29]KQW06111.1 hypothetical protein ASC98_26365 [Rhizobacter sp. Root1238]KRB19410.1 hypothetical protein ASE08_23935 [Rhizobacter sp. Root16D2]